MEEQWKAELVEVTTRLFDEWLAQMVKAGSKVVKEKDGNFYNHSHKSNGHPTIVGKRGIARSILVIRYKIG